MKVKELIELLQKQDPEKRVVSHVYNGVYNQYDYAEFVISGHYFKNHRFKDIQFTSDLPDDLADGVITKQDANNSEEVVCIW